jgi:hypothetical protein
MAEVNQRNDINNIIYNMNTQTVTMPTHNELRIDNSEALNQNFS